MITSIDLLGKFQEKINELLPENKNEKDLRKKIASGTTSKHIFRDMDLISASRGTDMLIISCLHQIICTKLSEPCHDYCFNTQYFKERLADLS